MLAPHVSVSIAQTVFYLPMVPLVFYIIIRNWSTRARLPWLPMALFCLMRLAGGAVVIAQNYDQTNLGLIISAIVLLNVGVVPLLISMVGLVRLILGVPPSTRNGKLHRVVAIIRTIVVIAACLLAAGGALEGSSDATVVAGRDLSEAGYIVLAASILAIFWVLFELQRAVRRGDTTLDTVYMRGACISIPFLVVRAIYGIIYAFTSDDMTSVWNPLYGNTVAFALMALLPEYIILCIFIHMGFYRIRSNIPIGYKTTESVVV
ncbi:hypothetical protein BX600DRAFT_462958 [Xylariales sp. PMI_506]|nr:hypothetical protein BX600DRAFT_462958 [Xylariales sp. PMI_506]